MDVGTGRRCYSQMAACRPCLSPRLRDPSRGLWLRLGGQHVANWMEEHRRFDLAGVFAPELTGTSTDGHSVYGSYEAMLEDASVQAVILTSLNDQHEVRAMAAVSVGNHVFCEKPLSLTGDSARRIVDAVADAGKVLGIGHERRSDQSTQRLAAMDRAGDPGTVMQMEAAFSHDRLAGATQRQLARAARIGACCRNDRDGNSPDRFHDLDVRPGGERSGRCVGS